MIYMQCNGHLQRYRNCRPLFLAPRMSAFFNKAFTEIIGAKVNRELAMAWKSHMFYCLYGPNVYVDKMKELVESLLADGHYNLCNNITQ